MSCQVMLPSFVGREAMARTRPPHARLLVLSLGIVLGLLFALSGSKARGGFAEWLVNDDERGEENRFEPVTVRIEGGGFLVLWADNGRGHTDILGRVFESDLTPRGEIFKINSGEGFFPALDVDLSPPAGGVITAVWTDERNHRKDVYARLFSASDGGALGSDFQVSVESTLGVAVRPRVTTNATGMSLVCWSANLHGYPVVLLQLLDPLGQRVGGNQMPVPENPGQPQTNPVAAPLADGRWILAWQAESDDDDDIYYRILAADGSPGGAIRQANQELLIESAQDEPALLVRSADVLIAWRDNRQSTSDVWGRWLDLDGSPLGPDSRMREIQDPPTDLRPRLYRGLGDDFALTWFGGIEDRARAMVRFYAADQSPLGPSRAMSDPGREVLMQEGSAAPLSPGVWLLAWSDTRSLNRQVYLQRNDPTTGPLGELETAWSSPGSASQVYGDLALFPDGRAIVVWGDLESGVLNIHGRFLDETGQPIGTSFQVNDVPVSNIFETINGIESIRNFSPTVAASASNFVITWAVNAQGGRLGLYGQLYDAAGAAIGGNFHILPEHRYENTQFDARPAMLPDGRFLIVWRENLADAGGDIFLQHYQADGLPIGEPILAIDINAAAAAQQLPEVSVSPFEEVGVTWIDHRFGGWDIYLQRYSPNGDRIGQNHHESPPDPPENEQLNPAVAVGEDRVITVWEDRPQTIGAIRGRLEIFETLAFKEGGEPGPRVVEKSEIYFDVTGDLPSSGFKYPRVATEPSGRFLVVWWDDADRQSRILAQRYNADGSPLGQPYRITEGSGGNRAWPRVALDGERIQYVWTDSRRAQGWDIYSRRVDWNFSGGPVPVGLASWRVESVEAGVSLVWSTSLERGTTGFRIWRQPLDERDGGARPSDRATLLTPQPISPSGAGTEYRYLDSTALYGEWVAYFLEALDLDGTSEYFGPLPVMREASVSTSSWSASPNPFWDRVALRSKVAGPYRVVIRDVAGRRVAALEGTADGLMPVWWDGRTPAGSALPPGVYWADPSGGGGALKLLRLR